MSAKQATTTATALAVSVGLVLVLRSLGGAGESKTVTVVARHMQFHVEGAEGLQVGDRVTLIIRNEEPPGTPNAYHNFQIAGYGVRLQEPLDPGQAATLVVDLRESGRFTFRCPVHPGVMEGPWIVQP